MRAVQITRFGGPEVLYVVDLPEPEEAGALDRLDRGGGDHRHHEDAVDRPPERPPQQQAPGTSITMS